MTTNLSGELAEALSHLVNALPQDSTKGKRVTEWFNKEFNQEGRASIVTDKKQVYNRVPEQFRHKSPHVIFVYTLDEILTKLSEQVKVHRYLGLQTVLFVKKNDEQFNPEFLYFTTNSKVKDYYEQHCPDLNQEEILLNSLNDTSDETVFSINLNLTNLEDNNPCNLVALGKQFRQAVSALQAEKQIIFLGPPGTGKTELAICLCKSFGFSYDIVTATSDWTTFETIGGYLPDPSLATDGKSEPLNFFPSIILLSFLNKRWLIIDEINRADIDKAFGEMFTLLTGKNIKLPFKKREGEKLLDIVIGNADEIAKYNESEQETYVIPVPKDWRMIGTMNTFDKASLFQLSYAFMRRFAFIDIPIPTQDDYKNILTEKASILINEDNNVFYTECMKYLEGIFAPKDDEGLAKIDLLVGPAIPIDIIKYLYQRKNFINTMTDTNEIKLIFLEAIEMYLYPQFESKDRKHEDILNLIAEVLDLQTFNKKKTGKLLANWTGYELGL